MNEVKALKINIVAIIALTTLTHADQKTIVSKYNITNEDNFNIECDVFKFNPKNNDFMTIHEMFVERKIDLETNYTELARFYPFNSMTQGRNKKTPPEGRLWGYEFMGDDSTWNRNTIRITLIVKDATCADAGLYRCGMRTELSQNYVYSSAFTLATTVNTIQQGFITMTPTSGHSDFFSRNRVGDDISLTCTLTGPPGLQTSWTFSTKEKPDNETVYPVKKGITLFPTEGAFDCNACMATFYMTSLQFSMTARADGNTYYCSASDGKTLNSKANFTIYIE